jgi:hypothetical protein
LIFGGTEGTITNDAAGEKTLKGRRQRRKIHTCMTLKEVSMQRKSVSRTSMVATPMMIVCLLFAGSSAWADDGQPLCTLKTLKGRYLFVDKVTNLPPAFGVTGPTPATNAGFHLFNGDGTGTDIVTFILNGVTILRNAAAPFSYTVNADCTGTITVHVPNGPHFDIFVDPNGEAVAYIGADPGNGVNHISQRVSPK